MTEERVVAVPLEVQRVFASLEEVWRDEASFGCIWLQAIAIGIMMKWRTIDPPTGKMRCCACREVGSVVVCTRVHKVIR